MQPPSTADDFLYLVRRSGLLSSHQLGAFLAARAPGDDTPRALAAAMVREGLLTYFQSHQLLAGKYRGFVLGNYKILEHLGAGGMGTVLLCEHLQMRHRVAVKVLPPDKARDPSALTRFYREARAAARLDHPNLVRAHDVGRDGDRHFLVLEYVDGVSLQELVNQRGPLDVTRACHYVRQAALGLQHAHEAGLVHRDVKPANLLLDRRGTVKVTDLGLARFSADEPDPLTHKYDGNRVLGSADYLAPEQALDSHAVDARADVYSLGATLYFLLAGRPPFSGGTAVQTRLRRDAQGPSPLRAARRDVPAGLAAVVARMLAHDPDGRYATPADAARALERWARGPAGPPPGVAWRRLSHAALGPSSSELPAAPAPPAADRETETRTWARLAAAGLALAAAVGLALVFLKWGGPAAHAAAKGPVWLVPAEGRETAYPTLAEALAEARPGDRVVVRAEAVEGPVALERDAGRDVLVEGQAPSGGPVLWRAGPGHAAGRPLLAVSDVAGLRLRGFVLDGREQIADLVVVSGRCPGLALEDLHLRGFRRAAVRLEQARGEAARPLTLARLRATAATRSDTALTFTAAPGRAGAHVHVCDCRFEGPYQYAVLFAGAADGVEFRRNRFFRATHGLYFPRAEAKAETRLALASNTFCEVPTALRFGSADDAVEVEAHNNLFARVGRLARADDFTPARATPAEWVGFPDGRPGPDAPPEARYFRKAFAVPRQELARAVLDIACDDAFTAWLNGEEVGRGELGAGRRVHGFDVTRLLRPGKNVLAVRGDNRPSGRGGETPAGLLAHLGYATASGGAAAVVTDASWKSARGGPPEWNRPDYDDDAWRSVRVLGPYGRGQKAWQALVWDSVVREQFAGGACPLLPAPRGNCCDPQSEDGFPTLLSRQVEATLGTDPNNEAEFLRYPKGSPLATAGVDKAPVGVPPPD